AHWAEKRERFACSTRITIMCRQFFKKNGNDVDLICHQLTAQVA
uniref:Uncharacterized protein n=1 Tax=Caenorhabditis japonica TaxID=281687 RepID=A0A8R1IBR9_CAEJA